MIFCSYDVETKGNTIMSKYPCQNLLKSYDYDLYQKVHNAATGKALETFPYVDYPMVTVTTNKGNNISFPYSDLLRKCLSFTTSCREFLAVH
jgi:hypothetical protein